MNTKRTEVDFSKHVVDVTKQDRLLVHYIHLPNTIVNSVKFINTNDIMAVTGDFGNWIFCREFHPSATGGVSDGYWREKLGISSCQDPLEFVSDIAKAEIKEMLEDEDRTFTEEEREWLGELSDAADEGEYEYIATAMHRPSSFEAECIPKGKRVTFWLLVVFDAFEEICKRIKEGAVTV